MICKITATFFFYVSAHLLLMTWNYSELVTLNKIRYVICYHDSFNMLLTFRNKKIYVFFPFIIMRFKCSWPKFCFFHIFLECPKRLLSNQTHYYYAFPTLLVYHRLFFPQFNFSITTCHHSFRNSFYIIQLSFCFLWFKFNALNNVLICQIMKVIEWWLLM